jgi:hypothetical protein
MPSDLLSTIRAEIVARLDELRPLLLEYEQLLADAEAIERERAAGATTPRARRRSAGAPSRSAPGSRRRSAGPRRNQASAAILAALEHGSHTTAELTVVTGLSAASIRRELRLLLGEGAITRTTRAGKTAYMLGA